ncbi:hypothetical protein [Noviherbaspirillum malthae]|uniref:hypothetical protein n=1 Tax=Noviherbaspirillum malthae TaxID=1260987 RepID=UPI00188FEBEA|nr:hypothetical protein [Noviherbaspirillum malthae]
MPIINPGTGTSAFESGDGSDRIRTLVSRLTGHAQPFHIGLLMTGSGVSMKNWQVRG